MMVSDRQNHHLAVQDHRLASSVTTGSHGDAGCVAHGIVPERANVGHRRAGLVRWQRAARRCPGARGVPVEAAGRLRPTLSAMLAIELDGASQYFAIK